MQAERQHPATGTDMSKRVSCSTRLPVPSLAPPGAYRYEALALCVTSDSDALPVLLALSSSSLLVSRVAPSSSSRPFVLPVLTPPMLIKLTLYLRSVLRPSPCLPVAPHPSYADQFDVALASIRHCTCALCCVCLPVRRSSTASMRRQRGQGIQRQAPGPVGWTARAAAPQGGQAKAAPSAGTRRTPRHGSRPAPTSRTPSQRRSAPSSGGSSTSSACACVSVFSVSASVLVLQTCRNL